MNTVKKKNWWKKSWRKTDKNLWIKSTLKKMKLSGQSRKFTNKVNAINVDILWIKSRQSNGWMDLRAWAAEPRSDVGCCATCLCVRHRAGRTSPWRGGRPPSPPGPDSLGDPPCHSTARGIRRCPAPSPPRPWWCRRWETQWLQVSGLGAKKGLQTINFCKATHGFISDNKQNL